MSIGLSRGCVEFFDKKMSIGFTMIGTGWYMRYQSNEKHDKLRHRVFISESDPAESSASHADPFKIPSEVE